MQPAPRNLLFIVGAPRSGTKLLRHLLNNHSRVALTTNETEFLPYLVAFCANARLSTEAGFRRFAAYLRLEDYVFHRRSERGAEVDFEGWRAAVRSDCPADAFRAFMQLETAPSALTTIIGDKSPRYARCLPMIFQHFPEARVVHIVRDPRRQAGSLRRVFGKRISQSAAAWQATIDAVAAGQSAHPERIFELSYEALTAEPEATLRGLCDFLGLEFESGMLEVERNIERGGAATTGLGPAGRVALFDDLSMQDIALVESLAARGMAAHGYTPLAPPLRRRAVPQFRALSRLGGLVGLGTKVLARDGVGALVRKLRLVRARRMILAGRW